MAFPERRAGRHPQLSFRGLLKLHSRYGLQTRSPTLCGLCHEAPIPPVNPAKRPVSYPVIPTTPGVGLPPTGNLRLWGARSFRNFSRPRGTSSGIGFVFATYCLTLTQPNWVRFAILVGKATNCRRTSATRVHLGAVTL